MAGRHGAQVITLSEVKGRSKDGAMLCDARLRFRKTAGLTCEGEAKRCGFILNESRKTFIVSECTETPNENKISHRWRGRAWFAMDVFS